MVNLPIVLDTVDTRGLRRALITHGAVIVASGSERASLLDLCGRLGTLRPHPDSDLDSLTTIEDRGASESGKLAFSTQEIAIHTDRSSDEIPPAFIAMLCERDECIGGETVLCDGRSVYRKLAVEAPSVLVMLKSPVLQIGGNLRPIYIEQNGRIYIRFRSDKLAQCQEVARAALAVFRRFAQAMSWTIRIPCGAIIILNNGWMLHGRLKYQGSRRMVRALFDGKAELESGIGFPKE